MRPTLRALLESLEPAPAVLLNRMGDIVAWTQGYERYARPLGLLDGDPPNMMRYLFTDDRSRAVFPGWDRVADEQVAHLRNESSLYDPHIAVLADELTAAGRRSVTVSPLFRPRPPVSGSRWSSIPRQVACVCRSRRSCLPTRAVAWGCTYRPTRPRPPRWTVSTAAGRGPCGQ